jgi:hypothetical protein
VALLGIAPTSHAQAAFRDSQQWAVRADVTCAAGPWSGRTGDLLAPARDVALRLPHG